MPTNNPFANPTSNPVVATTTTSTANPSGSPITTMVPSDSPVNSVRTTSSENGGDDDDDDENENTNGPLGLNDDSAGILGMAPDTFIYIIIGAGVLLFFFVIIGGYLLYRRHKIARIHSQVQSFDMEDGNNPTGFEQRPHNPLW